MKSKLFVNVVILVQCFRNQYKVVVYVIKKALNKYLHLVLFTICTLNRSYMDPKTNKFKQNNNFNEKPTLIYMYQFLCISIKPTLV